MSHLIMAPLLVPLLAGAILILLPGTATRLRRGFSLLATAALVGVALALVLRVSGGDVIVYQLGDWAAPFGIVLIADRLAGALVFITAVLAMCVVAYAVRGSDRAGRHFHNLLHFQLLGVNGAFLTGDLFNLFVFFEVLLIASYGLVLHGGGRERTRAGLHYVILNLIGSTLFLFAVGTLYGILGTLNMADLAVRVAALPEQDLGVVRAAALLLLVVFGLKGALAPLHLWLPSAYASASPAVAALFAIMTKVGAYSILRVYSLVFGDAAGPLAGLVAAWLLPLGLATVVLGACGVLASERLGQMTAQLVIVSAGTLLVAFGLGGAESVAAGLYYLVHSTFAAAALFLLADLLARTRGDWRDRLRPGPVLDRGNLLGGVFIVMAVSIAGMPPLSGFIGKFLILRSSIATPWSAVVLAVILATSLLIIVSLVRAGSRLFFEFQPGVRAAGSLATADLLPPLVLMLTGLVLVLLAGPVYEFAHAAAQQLMRPSLYIEAVLGNLAGAASP